MKNTIQPARLRERKSDERDAFTLSNALRDSANATGHYATSLRTTDATATELWSDVVPGDATLVLTATIAAASSANYAAYSRRVVVSRTGDANAVMQDNATILTDIETDASWNVAFSVSGGSVVLKVTGAAATTIDWRVSIDATWSTKR